MCTLSVYELFAPKVCLNGSWQIVIVTLLGVSPGHSLVSPCLSGSATYDTGLRTEKDHFLA